MIVCAVCRGISGHPPMEPEGGSVCYPCVLRIGRVVADPSPITTGEYHLLEQMHGDVCRLAITPGGTPYWRWDRSWPGGDEVVA